MSLVVN